MLEARNVSYTYAYADEAVLTNVSLTVHPGEYVAILGANGAGKSTLVHVLNGSFTPSEGHVLLDGNEAEPVELAQAVGLVRQDPRSQIVSPSLTDEIAFGPRNLGLPREEIQQRVTEALELCELDGLVNHGTNELSGGQQQRLALAGVLAMHPSYLILDEALSQLDSRSRSALSGIISSLADKGIGIISITHRFEELKDANRVIVFEHGCLAWEGSVRNLIADAQLWQRAGVTCDGLDDALPLLSTFAPADKSLWELDKLAARVREREQAAEVLARLPHPSATPYAGVDKNGVSEGSEDSLQGEASRGLLQALHVSASYGETLALNDVTAHFLPGTVTVVGGMSGSGKTTLARILAGVAESDSGEVALGGKRVRPAQVGLAFQRPEDQLFCDSVLEDVAFGPKALRQSEDDALIAAQEACEQLGIPETLFSRHPLALSGGQRRLVALAGLVALDAASYVLDEPTAGLDAKSAEYLRDLVCKLARDGKSVVVVSHDLGEWLAIAQHVYLMHEGCVEWSGSTVDALENPTVFEQASLAIPTWVALAHKLGERVQ